MVTPASTTAPSLKRTIRREPGRVRKQFIRYERTFNRLALLTGTLTALGVAWLALIALNDDLRTTAPSWIQWFGKPGSGKAALLLALLFIATLVFRRLPRYQMKKGATTLVLAALTLIVLLLGMTSFIHCHPGPGNLYLGSIYDTLAMFTGGSGSFNETCSAAYPVALDISRITALIVVLVAAIATGMKLFRSQYDRAVIRLGGLLGRFRGLTIVVGVEDDVTGLIRDIAATKVPRSTLLVITSNADRTCVHQVQEMGARIFELDLAESENLSTLKVWRRAQRIYLLSDDPELNFERFDAIDTAVAEHHKKLRTGKNSRIRVQMTLRIDDPWHADHWRRQLVEGRRGRWALDSVGKYQFTAALLIRQMMANEQRLPQRVYIDTGPALAYSLLSELDQLKRQNRLIESICASEAQHTKRRPPTPPIPEVVLLGEDRESIRRDYLDRSASGNDTHANDLDVRCEPGITFAEITEILDREVDSTEAAVAPSESDRSEGSDSTTNKVRVLAAHQVTVILERSTPESLIEATRLGTRFARVPIYAGGASVRLASSAPVVGRLINFPLSLDLDGTTTRDVWERAAELKHQLYVINRDEENPSSKDWDELDPFYKDSNRREVHDCLWMVEKLADCTWDTFYSPQGLPDLTDITLDGTMQGFERAAEIAGIQRTDFLGLLKAEHENWLDYYKDRGWKKRDIRTKDLTGTERKKAQFKRRRNPNLIPWSETTQEDHLRSAESFIKLLRVLNVLGYSSMPQWKLYARNPNLFVHASRLTEEFVWHDGHGVEKRGSAGDWKLLFPDGTTRSITTQSLLDGYTEIPGSHGIHRRSGWTLGRRAIPREQVVSKEQSGTIPDIAVAGDYVFRSDEGGVWLVGPQGFRDGYLADTPDRK